MQKNNSRAAFGILIEDPAAVFQKKRFLCKVGKTASVPAEFLLDCKSVDDDFLVLSSIFVQIRVYIYYGISVYLSLFDQLICHYIVCLNKNKFITVTAKHIYNMYTFYLQICMMNTMIYATYDIIIW